MPLRLTESEFAALKGRRDGSPAAKRYDGKRWEREFSYQLDCHRIAYCREYRFSATRKFRFDFAWPEKKLALEIDGGVHRIDKRFKSDREKGNLALLDGWRVLHVGSAQVQNGEALQMLVKMLAVAKEKTQTKAIDRVKKRE